MAGHLLAACLHYGQVLASAVSRLVSAAAALPPTSTHPPIPHTHPFLSSSSSVFSSPLFSPSLPPDRCSHTTTTTQLFMDPACFDFKYLPRRRLLSLGEGGIFFERGLERLTTLHICRHTLYICICIHIYTHTIFVYVYTCAIPTATCFYMCTPVWAGAESPLTITCVLDEEYQELKNTSSYYLTATGL